MHFAESVKAVVSRRWDEAVLLGLVTVIVGMIAYLLIPRPVAEIRLETFRSGSRSALIVPEETALVAKESVETLQAAPKKKSRTSKTPKKPAKPPVLNLNTATLSQLELLPGIGPKMAERIVDYRKANGPFTSVEQVMEVKGIGSKKFEKLQPYLKL